MSHGLAASTVPGTGSSDAELLARVAEEAELPSEAERRVLEARDPTRALAALAVTEMAELLVVGARGRGRVAAAALGSVSRGLVAAAPCPVVVVPAAAACERAEGRGSPSVVCAVDRSTESREVVRVAEEAIVSVHTHSEKRAWYERMREAAQKAMAKAPRAVPKPARPPTGSGAPDGGRGAGG